MPSRDYTTQITKGVVMTVKVDSTEDEPTQTISIDADTEFTVPYHFHLLTDEYLRITHGVVEVTMAGKQVIRTPEMGDLRVPVGVRHGIHKSKGVARGWTARNIPNLPEKATFFREFSAHGPPTLLSVMSDAYREGDTAPVIGGDWTPDVFCKALVWIIGGFIGNFLGFSAAPKMKDE